MKKIAGCIKSTFCCLDKLNIIPLLLSRLTIGAIFIGSGLGKLTHLEKVTAYFTSLGMPFPHFVTPFTALFELVCGFFVLFGFATRFAAVPLIVIMIVAIRTAKWEDVTGLYSIFQLSEFLYIVLLLWIVVQGAGQFSVDCFISKKCCSNEKCSPKN